LPDQRLVFQCEVNRLLKVYLGGRSFWRLGK
jgi:hypothetical protein